MILKIWHKNNFNKEKNKHLQIQLEKITYLKQQLKSQFYKRKFKTINSQIYLAKIHLKIENIFIIQMKKVRAQRRKQDYHKFKNFTKNSKNWTKDLNQASKLKIQQLHLW